jgi:hypothetical protein
LAGMILLRNRGFEMTNLNNETREMKIEELDLVSGGKPNTESGVKGISASGSVSGTVATAWAHFWFDI